MNDTSKHAHMNFEELMEKYQRLLFENKNLKLELKKLKERIAILENQSISEQSSDVLSLESGYLAEESLSPNISCENETQVFISGVNNFSEPKDKIELSKTQNFIKCRLCACQPAKFLESYRARKKRPNTYVCQEARSKIYRQFWRNMQLTYIM